MPGKVNPTQSEMLTMVCVQVFGYDAAITFAGSQGNFELNVFKPIIAHDLLHGIELLTDGCRIVPRALRRGPRGRRRADRRAPRQLADARDGARPAIGYDKAAEIAKKAHHEGTTLREAALALGYLTAAEFDAAIDPAAMTQTVGRLSVPTAWAAASG